MHRTSGTAANSRPALGYRITWREVPASFLKWLLPDLASENAHPTGTVHSTLTRMYLEEVANAISPKAHDLPMQRKGAVAPQRIDPLAG
jgi:hypothetical protein